MKMVCLVGLTGNMLGDIESIPTEQEMIIQSGAYVASIGDITLDTQWQGFKRGIFGSSLFMLKTVGTGEIFVNAYGGIIQKELKEDETMTIDNYHLVAMSGTISYDIRKHGNLKTTIFGGEALVIEVKGPGDVFLQTKNIMSLQDQSHRFCQTENNNRN